MDSILPETGKTPFKNEILLDYNYLHNTVRVMIQNKESDESIIKYIKKYPHFKFQIKSGTHIVIDALLSGKEALAIKFIGTTFDLMDYNGKEIYGMTENSAEPNIFNYALDNGMFNFARKFAVMTPRPGASCNYRDGWPTILEMAIIYKREDIAMAVLRNIDFSCRIYLKDYFKFIDIDAEFINYKGRSFDHWKSFFDMKKAYKKFFEMSKTVDEEELIERLDDFYFTMPDVAKDCIKLIRKKQELRFM